MQAGLRSKRHEGSVLHDVKECETPFKSCVCTIFNGVPRFWNHAPVTDCYRALVFSFVDFDAECSVHQGVREFRSLHSAHRHALSLPLPGRV